jgi:RNA polymerase sigma-70 factor, ECF subfamily
MTTTADPIRSVEEIYGQYADFAWRCLRRMGVPHDDLADAMQDVFLTVHRTLGGFQGRASLSTWMFTICRSVARDRRVRAFRRYEVAAGDDLPEPIDLRANPEAHAEQNQRVRILETILAGLDMDLRNVFVLFEIEAMTGDEISEVLGIPSGTVYSRLAQARATFRRGLADMQVGERAFPPVGAGKT